MKVKRIDKIKLLLKYLGYVPDKTRNLKYEKFVCDGKLCIWVNERELRTGETLGKSYSITKQIPSLLKRYNI